MKNKCIKCKKPYKKASLTNEGWVCHNCRLMIGTWTERDKIRSTARMPDGSILRGREGQRIVDDRLRNQERGEKMRVK